MWGNSWYCIMWTVIWKQHGWKTFSLCSFIFHAATNFDWLGSGFVQAYTCLIDSFYICCLYMLIFSLVLLSPSLHPLSSPWHWHSLMLQKSFLRWNEVWMGVAREARHPPTSPPPSAPPTICQGLRTEYCKEKGMGSSPSTPLLLPRKVSDRFQAGLSSEIQAYLGPDCPQHCIALVNNAVH